MSDLERRLLSKCLDPEAITEAYANGVRAEQFEDPMCRDIWKFTVEYWQKFQKSAPTEWALKEEFPGYTAMEQVPEETVYLADLIIRRKVTNRLQEIVREASSTANSLPLETAKQLEIDILALNEITRSRITEVDMGDTIQARRERYARRSESPQGMGVTYGIDLLDIHTGGILPGELAVLGAYAKTGKTMFLLNAAAEAKRQRLTPLIYSLELSLDDTQERLDAMWSGVSYNKLSRGHLLIDELKILHEKQDELRDEYGGVPILRPNEGDRTIGSLLARARQLGCNYLIIDQLSKLEAGHKTYSQKEKYNSILAQLKNEISRPGQEIPCLMAVQLRREGGIEPTIESFADAAEIERDCDIALTLWRSRDLLNAHLMKLNIVATRRSDYTAWLLNWELTNATRIAASEEIR